MKQNNAVILARVSSLGQKQEGYSLDSQTKLLIEYCSKNDFRVLKIFEIAETASKQQGRRIFQELMTYIASNEITHLAIEKTDRFTRNLRDAVTIDDWLEADETRRLHAVKESLIVHKYAKSDVKFMWNIYVSVAKKYTDTLREEAMKGWAEKIAQGWLPAPPPPGYRTVIVGGKKIHQPEQSERRLMTRVFKRYLEPGESCVTIGEYMAELGLYTKNGRPYRKSSVHRILGNPFYIGKIRFQGVESQGAQEPIIPRPLFDAVQAKLSGGRPQKYRRHQSLLKGIIRCHDCGSLVTWQLQKGHYYGVCRRLSESCKRGKMLREDVVEEQVVEAMQRLVSPDSKIMDWVVQELRSEHADSIALHEQTRLSYQRELEHIERMDNRLYDDKLSETITEEKYEQKHAQFTNQIDSLKTKITQLQDDTSGLLDHRLVLLDLTQKAAEVYQKKSSEQKRLIISKLFKSMELKAGSLSVTYTNFVNIVAENIQKTNQLIGD